MTKINPAALARALANNPTPRIHASARRTPIPIGVPLAPRPDGKWPTHAYAAWRKLKEERRTQRRLKALLGELSA